MSSFQRLGGVATSEVAVPTATGLRGRRYGDDRLHLLTRDPRRLFATWEISPALAARAAAVAAKAGAPIRYQLRVIRTDRPEGAPRETLTHDLPDAVGGESWNVDLPSGGGAARAFIGLALPEGFETLLASRWTPVPPEGPCAEEGEWPLDDEAAAWLAREVARQRGASGSRMPSSATRYLPAAEPTRDR